MSLFAGDGSSASPDSAEQLKDVLTIIRCKVSIFMIGRLPRLQSWWSHNCSGFIWIAWLPEDTALCVDIIIIRNNIRVASLSVSAPALALNRVSEVAPGPVSGGRVVTRCDESWQGSWHRVTCHVTYVTLSPLSRPHLTWLPCPVSNWLWRAEWWWWVFVSGQCHNWYHPRIPIPVW